VKEVDVDGKRMACDTYSSIQVEVRKVEARMEVAKVVVVVVKRQVF